MAWRVGVSVVVLISSAVTAHASTLFPQPLHLVRKVTDPISRLTTTVDEYCLGNRIVSASGTRSVIVDYDKQTVTEIDRAAGTFSISSFDEIARANTALRPATATQESAGRGEWSATALGTRAATAGGQSATAWKFSRPGIAIEVAVDPRTSLSREALDALIGASYPNRRTPEHDALTRAAGGGTERARAESITPQTEVFALPLEETITWEAESSRLVMRNFVVAVTRDIAPAEILTIPAGAKRVQSTRVALPRLLDEMDKLPNAPPRP